MTATELAERRARVMAEFNAGRPEATEPEIVPIFKPGAITSEIASMGGVVAQPAVGSIAQEATEKAISLVKHG